MSFSLTPKQKVHLKPLTNLNPEDITALCKAALDYVVNGWEAQKVVYESLATKYNHLQLKEEDVRCAVQALISLIVEAAMNNSELKSIETHLLQSDFNADAVQVLIQFINNKRNFIMGCLKTEDIDYHLINLDWRLEIRVASRALLKQSAVCVTVKLNLRTEPKGENSALLNEYTKTNTDGYGKGKRKDVLVQIDLNSLKYMINTLEQALFESRTRRVRNLVSGLH